MVVPWHQFLAKLLAARAQRLVYLMLDTDEEHRPHAEQCEHRDLLHDLVEKMAMVEHLRCHVNNHGAALVHLDVRRARSEKIDEGGLWVDKGHELWVVRSEVKGNDPKLT